MRRAYTTLGLALGIGLVSETAHAQESQDRHPTPAVATARESTHHALSRTLHDSSSVADLPPTERDAAIRALIEQLGDDDVSVRQQAATSLQDFGHSAFDALYEARQHPTLEVALSAERLINLCRPPWTQDGDSENLRRVMKAYETYSRHGHQHRQHRKHMCLLTAAELPAHDRILALSRIVRFEMSPRLSRLAALELMSAEYSQDDLEREQYTHALVRELERSPRTGAEWVRTFFDASQQSEGTLQGLECHIEDEKERYPDYPENNDIVKKLWNCHAEEHLRQGDRDAARASMEQVCEYTNIDSVMDLSETILWLRKCGGEDVAFELMMQHKELCVSHPVLCTVLEEMGAKRGEDVSIVQPENAEAKTEDLLRTDWLPHALTLHHLGYKEDAISALRELITRLSENRDTLSLGYAHLALADALHEQRGHAEAANTLWQMFSETRQDLIIPHADKLPLSADEIAVRAHYFDARAALSEKRVDAGIEHLIAALERNPTDANALAALFRAATHDIDLLRTAEQMIEAAVDEKIGAMHEYEMQAHRNKNTIEFAYSKKCIAAIYAHEAAFLLLVIDQNPDLALHLATRANALQSHMPHYLHTLANAEYQAGDREAALMHQQEAARLDPHHPDINAQLQLLSDYSSGKISSALAHQHLADLSLETHAQPWCMRDFVTIMELNHYYGDTGRPVFSQIIYHTDHVEGWRLQKHVEQIPLPVFHTRHVAGGDNLSAPPCTTAHVAVWLDGVVLRKVMSHRVCETWTQYDIEGYERNFLPRDDRRGLRGAQEKKKMVYPFYPIRNR